MVRLTGENVPSDPPFAFDGQEEYSRARAEKSAPDFRIISKKRFRIPEVSLTFLLQFSF